MSRLPTSTGTVAVTCNRYQEPLRFVWGRTLFIVEQITDGWQVETDWWTSGQIVSRRYFTVTTTGGALFVLYYDLLDQGWHLEQVYD